tara:strand:+ start:3608 stop:4786 length:1179 start_codon:yes stop_codon:yes gene_type:complete
MATKINLRSPYYIKVSKTALTSVELKLYIYTGTFTANGSVAAGTLRYTINKKPLGTNAYVVFEVSELVRDYLEVEFNGEYNSESVWLNAIETVTGGSGSVTVTPDNTNGFIGLDGYGYFEEGANPTLSTTALQSNNSIIALDDNLFRVPVFVAGTESVSLLYKGEVKQTIDLSSASVDETTEQIRYITANSTSTGDVSYDSFQERVLNDGGTFEGSSCLSEFLDSVSIGLIDEVYVSSASGVEVFKVKTLEECLYTPIKVTFVNKFGAFQDLIFFKKSIDKTSVKGEEFKTAIFNQATLTYKTYQHQRTQFMVQGTDSITMNTGYISEDYNQVIEQLMLSEQVWATFITDTEEVRPLVPKTKSFTHKTQLNDKLIDYTIEFDIANNKINNIR